MTFAGISRVMVERHDFLSKFNVPKNYEYKCLYFFL